MSFEDPNYFNNTMYPYAYDPNHLAPSQDYLSRQRNSISSTSDIFASLSPSSSHAPPSLHQSSGSSQSPRSSASPHSNGFGVSDVELNELFNSASDTSFDFDQKPQIIDGNVQPQNLFLPNSGFGTMGGGSGYDYGKLQADQFASMLFQQQLQQQQQQTMAPQWMQQQQEVLKQAQFSQLPQNRTSKYTI